MLKQCPAIWRRRDQPLWRVQCYGEDGHSGHHWYYSPSNRQSDGCWTMPPKVAKIADPDYWQAYGVVVHNETLYNLRVKAYPDILNERGEKIGRVLS